MKEYLYSLLVIAVISLLSELLLPPGREKLRRAVSFGLALGSLLLIAAPLGGLPSLNFPTELPPSLEGDFSESLGETEGVIAEAVGAGIERDIASHFGLSAQDIDAAVTLFYEENEMKIASLTLSFAGSARYADLLAIRRYAEKTYEVMGEVTVDGGNGSRS